MKLSALLATLEQWFAKYPERHKGMQWSSVAARLQTHPDATRVLSMMEASGGEPDVIANWPNAKRA